MEKLLKKLDSSEINDGKLLIELRDEVVVEAEGEEVEDDVLLVDEVIEVTIVFEEGVGNENKNLKVQDCAKRLKYYAKKFQMSFIMQIRKKNISCNYF